MLAGKSQLSTVGFMYSKSTKKTKWKDEKEKWKTIAGILDPNASYQLYITF